MIRIDNSVAESPVLCDKRRIERALTNLIVNAQTHGEGLERVIVDHVGDVATITLDDNGPGVPVEDRELRVRTLLPRAEVRRTREHRWCGARYRARCRARAHPRWTRTHRETARKTRNPSSDRDPMASRLRRTTAVVVLIVTSVLVTACGVPTQSEPTRISRQRRPVQPLAEAGAQPARNDLDERRAVRPRSRPLRVSTRKRPEVGRDVHVPAPGRAQTVSSSGSRNRLRRRLCRGDPRATSSFGDGSATKNVARRSRSGVTEG